MFKNRIKEECYNQHTNCNQLAVKIGIAPSSVYQVANGRMIAFPKWRRLIADALHLPENEIFMDDIQKKVANG